MKYTMSREVGGEGKHAHPIKLVGYSFLNPYTLQLESETTKFKVNV
jgi:hypothetical protein